ncbi:MAG: Ig-like domain-containing protein [Chitinophagales bacterium]|nr:Ig-like domain-containing protein [Chitinophagales bacterium]
MMIKRILYYLCSCLVFSCATPGSPQGGPKDTYEPFAKLFEPYNYSTHFDEDKILITFDERIQLSNLNQNLIISPPIYPLPDIKVKKNLLTISFEKHLDSNTTYSIDFGNAIKDNNEGNIVSNLKYVFSTGQSLDSLSISGKVFTYDNQPIPENTFVLLYNTGIDSIFTKEKPKYIYKLGKDNLFHIDYLPKDSFLIFVLNDLNNNFIYDLPTEWVGKIDDTIFLSSSVSNLKLPIGLPESKDLKVVKVNSTNLYQILTIELNKEVNPIKDSIFLQNFSFESYQILKQNFASKFLNIFINSDSLSNSCELVINGIKVDILTFYRPSVSLENEVFLPMYQLSSKDSIFSSNNNSDFQFFCNVPISSIVPHKVFWVSEKDSLAVRNISIESDNWSFIVRDTLPENFSGSIVFLDSALTYSNSTFSSFSTWPIHSTPISEFGSLQFNILLPSIDTSYILRVFNETGFLFSEHLLLGDTLFTLPLEGFKSGKFFIEVIEDRNQSATWNAYSYLNNTPPEKVFKSELYEVRPNWENRHDIQVEFSQNQLPTPINNWLNYLINKNINTKSKGVSERERKDSRPPSQLKER